MPAASLHLALEAVAPGATLAEPLHDAQGSLLLPAGATLTEASLASLARHGVNTLAIVDTAAPPVDLEAERARVEARLSELFRGPRGRAEMALRALVAEYRIGSGT